MARPVYTDEFRAQAVALAVEFGPAEAARLVGCKPATLRAWCSRSGVVTVAATETIRHAVAARQAGMEERRAKLAERLLAEAEAAVEIELEKLADAKLYELVGARTRAIHDHQLLTGAATARTEHSTEPAHAAIDELAARRTRAA